MRSPTSIRTTAPLDAVAMYDTPVLSLSHSGIVHLAPVETPDTSTQSKASSKGSSNLGRYKTSSGVGNSRGSRNSNEEDLATNLGALSVADTQSDSLPSAPEDFGSGSGEEPGPLSGSDHSRVSLPSNRSGVSQASSGPIVSFRFEHVQNADGHHVVVGREGKLLRCEDEVGGICF